MPTMLILRLLLSGLTRAGPRLGQDKRDTGPSWSPLSGLAGRWTLGSSTRASLWGSAERRCVGRGTHSAQGVVSGRPSHGDSEALAGLLGEASAGRLPGREDRVRLSWELGQLGGTTWDSQARRSQRAAGVREGIGGLG